MTFTDPVLFASTILISLTSLLLLSNPLMALFFLVDDTLMVVSSLTVANQLVLLSLVAIHPVKNLSLVVFRMEVSGEAIRQML